MSDITIISHKRSSNFTIIPNHIINADYLKLEDKAFLIWVLSKPIDWKLNTLGLAKIHNVSKDKITGISKRLQKSGHLIIKKSKGGKTNWFIFEDVEDNLHYTPTTPVLKPHPEIQSEPHPEKPDQGNQDALLRTDPVVRTDQRKDPCPSADEHLEKCFDELWKHWPAKKNKIASRKAFKRYCRGKTSNAITELVNTIRIDIQEREKANEYCWDNHNLEKWIKGEHWDDVIKPGEKILNKMSAAEEQKIISDKANRAMAESRKRFKM